MYFLSLWDSFFSWVAGLKRLKARRTLTFETTKGDQPGKKDDDKTMNKTLDSLSGEHESSVTKDDSRLPKKEERKKTSHSSSGGKKTGEPLILLQTLD